MIWGIPEIDRIDEWIELSKKYDLAFEYNDFYYGPFLDNEQALEERIRRYEAIDRDRSKDTMHGAFLDVVVGSTDPRINEVSMFRIRQSLEIAKRLGIGGVVFHTNYITNLKLTSYRETWLKANVETFTRFCGEYPQINIYIENMFDENEELLLRLAQQMKDVKNFGVCLDLAHAYLSRRTPKEWLDSLIPYVKHMHINDNFMDEDSHLPVGSGSFDWELLRDPRIAEKAPSVLIETRGVEAFVQSVEYLKSNGLYPFS